MGGHHHGGGGHHGGHGGGWGGPRYWAEPSYAELVLTCPEVYDPVLATDGRVYDSPCLAQGAGVAVVKRMRPRGPLGDVSPTDVKAIAGVAALALAVWYFSGKGARTNRRREAFRTHSSAWKHRR